jgi:hypothetical protein
LVRAHKSGVSHRLFIVYAVQKIRHLDMHLAPAHVVILGHRHPDRSLNPDKPGIDDLIAVLNSGYKKGATRPVLVPAKGGNWETAEMPTFAPVAMAGNQPKLPDDTMSRTIRVLIMPDHDDTVDDSDWELIEDEAQAIADELAMWATSIRDQVRSGERPSLPEGAKARTKERWLPLKRVAVARDRRRSSPSFKRGLTTLPACVSGATMTDEEYAWCLAYVRAQREHLRDSGEGWREVVSAADHDAVQVSLFAGESRHPCPSHHAQPGESARDGAERAGVCHRRDVGRADETP